MVLDFYLYISYDIKENILLIKWDALYYQLPIGERQTGIETTFLLGALTPSPSLLETYLA